MIAAPAAAAADPVWNCDHYSYLGYADVVCHSGVIGGRYRVVAHCDGPWWRDDENMYGPWVGIGQTSLIRCEGGDTVTNVWHESAQAT